jgi:hypothetical protein
LCALLSCSSSLTLELIRKLFLFLTQASTRC